MFVGFKVFLSAKGRSATRLAMMERMMDGVGRVSMAGPDRLCVNPFYNLDTNL
jgi:hypothetical protein